MRKSHLALIVCALVGVWFLVVPLAAPRGYYFGYYRRIDLAMGGLAAVFAFAAVALALFPVRQRRKVAIYVSSLVVVFGGALLLLDAVYTLFVLDAWRPNYWLDQGHVSRMFSRSDDELGFVRAPNITWAGSTTYRTDENGFRNPPGIRSADIVFIGDSYTDAGEVPEEEIFVNRIGSMTGLNVVNLGRGAYGPQQELIVLRRHGLEFQPKYIVWQLFDGNDLDDATRYSNWRRGHTKQKSLPARFFAASLSRTWLKNMLDLPPVVGPPVRMKRPDGTNREISLRYGYLGDRVLENSTGVEETRKAMQEGVQLSHAAGAVPIVLFIPTMAQVHAEDIEFLRPEDREKYLPVGDAAGGFAGLVRAWCAELDCAFIDMLESFRQNKDSRELFIPNDEHLTAEGHAIVASEVVRVLNNLTSQRPKERQSSAMHVNACPRL